MEREVFAKIPPFHRKEKVEGFVVLKENLEKGNRWNQKEDKRKTVFHSGSFQK